MSSEFHEIELNVQGISQKFRVETYDNEICGLYLILEDTNGHDFIIDVSLWLIKLEDAIKETMEKYRDES